MAYGPYVALLSEDARFSSEEHEAARAPLAQWMRESRMTELPAKWAFFVTVGGIIVAKSAKPTVRQRLEMLALRARQIWARITGRGSAEMKRAA